MVFGVTRERVRQIEARPWPSSRTTERLALCAPSSTDAGRVRPRSLACCAAPLKKVTFERRLGQPKRVVLEGCGNKVGDAPASGVQKVWRKPGRDVRAAVRSAEEQAEAEAASAHGFINAAAEYHPAAERDMICGR